MSGCPFPEHHSHRGAPPGALVALALILAVGGSGAVGMVAHAVAGLVPLLLTVAVVALVLAFAVVIGVGVWRYREVHGTAQPQAVLAPAPVRPPSWPYRQPPGEAVDRVKEA